MTFPAFTAKTKECTHCKREFVPARPLQNVCSPRCASRLVKARSDAKKAKDRAELRERRRELETIPDLIKAAQKEFNAFIRERDKAKPCICCGKPLGEGDVGGGYDCGHYRSTGSAPHLRFDERNAAAQRKACNRWGAGRAVDYRIGLIQRIGLAEVEALESDNGVHRWTREELRAIRDTYKAKLKELKKEEA